MNAVRATSARGRRWLERQIARIAFPRGAIAGALTLTRRNVFVLPTRAGLLYGAALVAMLLASINYALSLGYLLTFLLAAVALVSMLQTFRNIVGLVLSTGRCEPVHAGQPAALHVLLRNARGPERFALELAMPEAASVTPVDIDAGADQPAQLALPTQRRGWMPLPRITLRTEYPLGLWRAWCWWRPALRVLVLPVAEAGRVPAPPALRPQAQGAGNAHAEEDLAGLRPWRADDPPTRIAWRAVARSGDDALIARQFEAGAAGDQLLDWHALPATLDTEARIRRLTRWVLDAHDTGAAWSLHLPGVRLGPDRGPAHRARCLEALAVFEAPA